MSEKRITKRDLFAELFEVVVESNIEDSRKELLCDFVNHELTLLNKKRNAPKTPTADQLANVAVKADILDVLSASEPMRAGDLAKALDKSVQKVSALLRQLVIANAVERIENGKVVTFTVKR